MNIASVAFLLLSETKGAASGRPLLWRLGDRNGAFARRGTPEGGGLALGELYQEGPIRVGVAEWPLRCPGMCSRTRLNPTDLPRNTFYFILPG